MADAFTSDTYNALCREAEDYLGRGLTEQARELLLKAVSLIGTRARARSLLADACMALGLWSEAREQLEQLITLELGSVQHHYRLGQVLEELKENENALDNYRVVLDLERDHRGASVAVTRITGHADPAAQGQPGTAQAPAETPAAQAPARPSPPGSFQVFPDQAGAEDEFATAGDVENLLRDIGVVESQDPLSGVSELLSSVGISLDPPAPEEKPQVEVQDVGSFIGSAPPASASDEGAFSLESVFGPSTEPPAQAVPPAAEAAPRPAPAPEQAPTPEPFDFTSIFRTAEVPASPGPVQAAAETPTDPLLQSIFGTGPLSPQMSAQTTMPAAAPEPEPEPGSAPEPAPVAEPAGAAGPAAIPEPAAVTEPAAMPGPAPVPESMAVAEPAAVMEPDAPAAAPDMPAPEIPAVLPEAGMAAAADDTLPVLESIFSFSTGEAPPSAAPAAAAGEAPEVEEMPPAAAGPAAAEPVPAEPAASEAPPAAAGPVASAEQAVPATSLPQQAFEPVQAGDVSLEVVFGETGAGGAEPAPVPSPEPPPEPAPEPVPEPALEPAQEPVPEPVPAPADAVAEEPSIEATAETAPGLVPALFEIHAAGPDELTRVDLIEGSLEVKLAYITGMDSSISVIADGGRRLLTGTGTIVLGQAQRKPVILDIAPGDLVRSDRLVLHDAGMVFSDAPSGILPSMVRVGGEGGWALAFTGGRSAVLEPGDRGLSVRAACIVQMQQGITAEADPDSHGFVRLSGGGTVLVST